jgi:hypothetical protein
MSKGHANTLSRYFQTVCFSFLFVVQSVNRPHPDNIVSSKILEPRFMKTRSFAQIYSFTALFDDTNNIRLIQMQFTLTNLGLSERNAACKILLLRKTGDLFNWNKKYNRKQWSYTKNVAQRLRIGSNQVLIQDDKTSASVDNQKIKVSITFDCTPEPVAPPNSDFTRNDRFFKYAVLIGWTKVEAVLEQPGTPQKRLHGYGMMELSRSTSFPSDICRGWITFRGYTDSADSYFLASLRLPRGDNSPAKGWIWRSPEQNPRAVNCVQFISEVVKKDRRRPIVPKIESPDMSFTIESRVLLSRYSIIDELGIVLGPIVKLVIGDPVTYYYEAKVTTTGNTHTIPGIMEFMRIE